jgi:hypothetical protein
MKRCHQNVAVRFAKGSFIYLDPNPLAPISVQRSAVATSAENGAADDGGETNDDWQIRFRCSNFDIR